MTKHKKSYKIGQLLVALTVALVLSLGVPGLGQAFSVASAATSDGKFYTDFASSEDERAAASDLNVEIFEESTVLLKNKDNALPLDNKLESNVTVFGTRSYDTVTGGTGSGAASTSSDFCSITGGLELGGFKVNSKVKGIYEEIIADKKSQAAVSAGMMGNASDTTVEANPSVLSAAEGSYAFYGDAAIWTIGRVGGEGADLMRSKLPTTQDKTKHILELDDNEMALLGYLKQKKEKGILNKIIVLINSANVMEMGVLEDDAQVDAILWIGQPGNSGLKGLGRILNGEVNPSGRTVDIWAADFTHDPTWQNTGKMTHLGTDPDTNQPYSNYAYQKQADGTYKKIDKTLYGKKADDKADGQIVEYEEGIYVGYKWYETAAADGVLNNTAIGYEASKAGDHEDIYYNRSTGVVYPFGYGQSYTTFKQTIKTPATTLEEAINASGTHILDKRVQVEVEVENTGKVAGKEVVQMYVHAPYTSGGIEKAEVALVSYAKTKLLAPNEKQTVTLDIRLGDIASFDYKDANGNGYKGYEIEAGAYEFRLQKNSHEKIAGLEVTLTAKTTELDNDDDAGNNTPFSNGDDYDSLLNIKDQTNAEGEVDATRGGKMKILSRADFAGTFPTAPKASDMLYGERVSKLLLIFADKAGESDEYTRYTSYTTGSDDMTTDPWYRTNDDIPDEWTQAANTDGRTNGKTAIQITDMIGIDYDDTKVIASGKFQGKTGVQAWTEFMNQLTYEELVTLCSSGSFSTPALDSIGKPRESDNDGPGQLSGGTFWCCEVNIASTWNTELAYRQGVMVGNESLLLGVTGWYAPSMNTHRSPFTGRNFEYYSQDGVQGGFIAAAVIKGYQSKGGVAYVKHYGMNDEEDNRLSGASFVDEQTMREDYLKVFEYAFKDGGAIATMTAHTRIGAISCYANYPLLQTLTTEEWGWKGYAITDMYLTTAKGNFVVRAGSLPLGSFSGTNKLTGEWDATLRNNKGGVRDSLLDADAAEGTKMEESPTQWYAVRTTAMRVCWGATKSNSLMNGYDMSVFSNKTFNLVQGVNGSSEIKIDTATFGTSDVKYAVTGGTLPNGLTLNEKTGVISGKPLQVTENAEVTISLIADGWAKTSAKISFKIAPMVTVEGGGQVKVGENFTANVKVNSAIQVVEKDTLTQAGQSGCTAIAYSAENLPEGLTIDEATGAITGNVATAGEYDVTVKVTATFVTVESGKKGTSQKETKEVQTSNVKVVVTEAAGNTESHGNIVSIGVNDKGELIYTYEDGTETNLGVIGGGSVENGGGTVTKDGNTGLIVFSIVLGVIALMAAAAAFVVMFLRKKKG